MLLSKPLAITSLNLLKVLRVKVQRASSRGLEKVLLGKLGSKSCPRRSHINLPNSAVTKPVVGVFDLAANVSEGKIALTLLYNSATLMAVKLGIRNTTTVFDRPARDRVRQVRGHQHPLHLLLILMPM